MKHHHRRSVDFKVQEIRGSFNELSVKQKVAERAAFAPCCSRQCLHSLIDTSPYDYTNSVELILKCRGELEGLDTERRYQFLFKKFEASVVLPEVAQPCSSENGRDKMSKKFNHAVDSVSSHAVKRRRLEHKFVLTTFDHKTVTVCRFAWCNAYGISHKILDSMSSAYKREEMEIDSDVLNDSGRPKLSFQEMEQLFRAHGLSTTHKAVQAAIMPKSQEALMGYFWMEIYFKQFGENAPNAAGEIHLDPIEKKTVWEEYVRDISDWYPDGKHYSYQKFVDLWTLLFPYVSIREYKAVSGKCNCCGLLSGYRWSYRDPIRRNLLKELHAFHRSTFMQERLSYYERSVSFSGCFIALILIYS